LSLIGQESEIGSNQHHAEDLRIPCSGVLHHGGRSPSGRKTLSADRWKGMEAMYPRACKVAGSFASSFIAKYCFLH